MDSKGLQSQFDIHTIRAAPVALTCGLNILKSKPPGYSRFMGGSHG